MGLDHPNVVPVYGAGEADGHLFIAMRLIEGEDLQQIIAAYGPLPGRARAHGSSGRSPAAWTPPMRAASSTEMSSPAT